MSDDLANMAAEARTAEIRLRCLRVVGIVSHPGTDPETLIRDAKVLESWIDGGKVPKRAPSQIFPADP